MKGTQILSKHLELQDDEGVFKVHVNVIIIKKLRI